MILLLAKPENTVEMFTLSVQLINCPCFCGKLFSSAEDTFDNSFPVNFVVYYTGDILFVPPGIVKSSCNIDITWFPFDEQICCLRVSTPKKFLFLRDKSSTQRVFQIGSRRMLFVTDLPLIKLKKVFENLIFIIKILLCKK